MYLGNDLYIHATGFAADARVTINSLNMHDPLYRPDLVSILTACGTIFKKEEQTADAPQEEASSDAASLTPALASCFEEIRPMLDAFAGNVSVLYKDLTTGAAFRYRTDYRHPSASVIKLYLMAAMFRGFEDGEFSPEDRIPVPAADFVPSCGVLTYLDADKNVSLRDLIELMIIVSDNTACNILVDFYGEERLQSYINQTLGLHATSFQRKMFDSARAARGMDNFTSTDETAGLLEQIWNGTLVSEDASRQMLQMLEHQRLNGKIPFHLHAVRPKPVIAHKTGENDGVSHDVAIFEGDHPFLLLFMGSETDVPAWERMIGDLSLQIYEAHRQGC
ncbi:MAG: serine hydrolase [Lachnospiraceae bacterium]|nr:serine hydrolase [Lachnospiraceae bacterium]